MLNDKGFQIGVPTSCFGDTFFHVFGDTYKSDREQQGEGHAQGPFAGGRRIDQDLL